MSGPCETPCSCAVAEPKCKACRPPLGARPTPPGVVPPVPDTSGCCYQRPGGCEAHRKPPISGTPAAMLGEALELLERAVRLLGAAGCTDLGAQAVTWAGDVRRAKREADAREGR